MSGSSGPASRPLCPRAPLGFSVRRTGAACSCGVLSEQGARKRPPPGGRGGHTAAAGGDSVLFAQRCKRCEAELRLWTAPARCCSTLT